MTGVALGHFVLEERIGRGGMGAVFRAIDSRLNRVVALKVLSPEHSSDPEAVIRFQNEARSAARLDHDNVSRVHYIGEEKGLHFIAFEFVTGTNVRNFILQKGRLNPADAVNYTLQIAEALRHTAAANVIHRDIKPSNIIVSPTGQAKLVDLGLARYTAPDASRDLTVDGTALGTFDYIAPEQAMNARSVDVRSDIYSLGCTLYHMLTGEPPYPKGTMFEKVMNHHRPIPPDPSLKSPHVSSQLARVVQKMMASNPDERYATPDSLISDLVLIARSLGLEPTHPETLVWTTPLFSRSSSRLEGVRTWGAIAVVLLLSVFLVYKLEQNPQALNVSLGPSGPSLNEAALKDSAADLDSASRLREQRQSLSDGGDDSSSSAKGSSRETPAVSVADAAPPQAFSRGMKSSAELLQSLILGPEAQATLANTAPLQDGGLKPAEVASAQAERSPTAVSTTVPVDPKNGVVSNQPSEPFVILAPGSETRAGLPTLAAACQAAPDNAVIEIQTDGIIDLGQEPLKIMNKRLRIRPAQNFRPVIRFDFSSQIPSRSYSRTVEMIHVDRGAVELYDMDLEMVVDPDSVIDLWTMISLAGGSELVARGVSFTMYNPSRMPATLLDLPESDVTDLGDLMPDRMVARRTLVQLSECVCRGEFDFSYQKNIDDVDYRLDNTGLVISGTMFRLDGSESYSMTMESSGKRATGINLNHVTAVLGEGMLRGTSGEHGILPAMNIDISNSVIRSDFEDVPLFSINGHDDYEILLEKLNFNQTHDPSFYQVAGPFCVIESATSLFPEAKELTLEEFGVPASHLIEENLLNFPQQMNLSLAHEYQPSEFLLRQDQSFINPARDAASDLQDAGVDWTLPRLPVTLPVAVSNE